MDDNLTDPSARRPSSELPVVTFGHQMAARGTLFEMITRVDGLSLDGAESCLKIGRASQAKMSLQR